MRYVCSLANPGTKGIPRELLYADDEEGRRRLQAFIEAENGQEGRGLYYYIGDLRDNARSRSKETVAAVPEIVVDLDLKSIEEQRERILGVLQGLLLPPTEIRDSGFGLHAVWRLKEAVADSDMALAEAAMKHLVELLAGDHAPTHRAALLRLPGTLNTKNGERRECRVIWQSNTCCDISEFDELFDLYDSRPLLTRKAPPPKSNGHDVAATPLDVTSALAAMRYQDGEHGFHTTLLRCSHALLRQGMPVGQVRDQLIDAARKAAACDPRCADWDWRREERDILRMAYDLINKNPEMISQLPEHFQEQWRGREAAGETHVQVKFSGFNGGTFCVAGRKPRAAAADDSAAGALGATDALKPKLKSPRKIRAIPFEAAYLAKLRPRAWLYDHHYQRGQVTVTIGTTGAGKSSLDLVEGIALATGRKLLHEEPAERCRVWVHNGDDDKDEVYRRIGAVCQHYDIPPAELESWLFITTNKDFGFKLVNGNGSGALTVDTNAVGAIKDTILENEVDVIIFEPLVTLHSVSENDNVRMNAVIHVFAEIAEDCNCAVELCHHTRKLANGAEEYGIDDSRGASAVMGGVRSLRIVNAMSAKEAGQAGIEEEKRRLYFRVDRGKANYLPPAMCLSWHQFESIVLPNTQDNVGVVTAWTFPGRMPRRRRRRPPPTVPPSTCSWKF